jgi:MFS family permease
MGLAKMSVSYRFNSEQQRNLKHNFIISMFDGGFFGFGMGFATFNTIIPLFVSQMTGSPLLIGLIPSIHSVGWQVPQLFLAKRISQQKHLKPLVLLMTTQERLPFLGLAALAWFMPAIGATWTLILTFLLLIWQGLGSGITANAWQNMIGKVFPAETRATFFGSQSAAANLTSSIGSVLAGIILEMNPSNAGYAGCFLICILLMAVSWIFLSTTREPLYSLADPSIEQPELWSNVKQILHSDRPFFGFLLSRMLFQFGMMGFSFYIVYAVDIIHMNVATAGVMTGILLFTQVIANPILGWIADHWNHKGVLEIGAVASALSCGLAWLAPTMAAFPVIMILEGIAVTTFWTIGLAYSLCFGPEHARPTYVGIVNTLSAPAAIIAPLLGGWLAAVSGYPITFLASAIASLITGVVLHFFITTPAKNKRTAL